MLKSWLVIAVVVFFVAWLGNKITPRSYAWFRRLRRPRWLTFEGAIPFIWISIFVCGSISAYLTWETAPGTGRTWALMIFYLLVEILVVAYTPVMFLTRSLLVGTVIGAAGFFAGLILASQVFPVSTNAGWLLAPYLLWSPIGTYVTWEMSRINPNDA